MLAELTMATGYFMLLFCNTYAGLPLCEVMFIRASLLPSFHFGGQFRMLIFLLLKQGDVYIHLPQPRFVFYSISVFRHRRLILALRPCLSFCFKVFPNSCSFSASLQLVAFFMARALLSHIYFKIRFFIHFQKFNILIQCLTLFAISILRHRLKLNLNDIALANEPAMLVTSN